MKKILNVFLWMVSFILLSMFFVDCSNPTKMSDDSGDNSIVSVENEGISFKNSEQCNFKIGDGEVFAQIPEDPGYPEGIAIGGGKLYITTPATFDTAGQGPSKIYIYNLFSKKLLYVISVEGENLEQEHALSGIALDYFNRLYVISTQLGILRFHQTQYDSYIQTQWSESFPDLNPDDSVSALPNDMVFDMFGNLYITDTLQGTIWKIPYTGGTLEIWFQSSELIVYNENQMGPNGIRLSPRRNYLYFAFTGSLPGDTMEREGKIYRLPLINNPSNDDLELIFTYPLFQCPDGIAFDAIGRLFVVMAGSNEISILKFDDADKRSLPLVQEVSRLTGPEGSEIPYMQPANIVFPSMYSRFVYVVNHSLYAPPPPNFFSILKVYVGIGGNYLEKPIIRN